MPKHNSSAGIHSIDEFSSMDSSIEVLIVDNNACDDKCLTELDLSLFTSLKVLEVGDYSFSFVNEVKLIDLSKLERVMIGEHCFRKSLNNDLNRHFYLKNCERLRELKMGCYSFSDYSTCEIEKMPSLEVIEMGELNEDSCNFSCASLKLKSDSERMK